MPVKEQPQSPRFYDFAPFRVDRDERVLLRDGAPIPLTPKAFETLLVLVSNRGRVVERDELMKLVWPDHFVEEGNVKVTIFMLRKALGEQDGERRYIETIARRGYRFVADVVTSAARPETPAMHSMAVLPFKAHDAGGHEYLGAGMTDTLITRLTNVRKIAVRPTSAVRRYTDPAQDPVAAGRDLGVGAVLDGSIRTSGDRIRVTAQLIDVASGTPLWADKFDSQLTADVFAVEDVISERVAEALLLELTREERQRLRKRQTVSIEAYQLYLKGRYHWMKRTSPGLQKGLELFAQAVDVDPNYALAYSGLADGFAQLGWLRFLPPHEAHQQSKAAATKAVELDPELAEAHTSLAWSRLLFEWKWPEAESGFRRAIALNPDYAVAHLWFAVHLMSLERYEESLVEVARAQALDPLSPVINAVAGWPFYFMRDYDRAIDQYERALRVEARNFPALILLGRALRQRGDASHALEAFEKARALDEIPWIFAEIAHTHARAGHEQEARRLLDRLQSIATRQYVNPYDIAPIHVALGEQDAAIALLQRAVETRSAWTILLRIEPAFDRLRSTPRFMELVRRIG